MVVKHLFKWSSGFLWKDRCGVASRGKGKGFLYTNFLWLHKSYIIVRLTVIKIPVFIAEADPGYAIVMETICISLSFILFRKLLCHLS